MSGRHIARKPKKQFTLLMVILFLMLTLAICFWIIFRNSSASLGVQSSAKDESALPTEVPIHEDGTIDIPGYETLKLKADSIEQTLTLPNPEQNDCYFRISLTLETGELLWQSDLIAPGETSTIELTQPLATGEYSGAVLLYECFSYDENKTPLNGATEKIKLIVE